MRTLEQMASAIEARYEPEPMSGCWLWIAGRNACGYGCIAHAKRVWGLSESLAHRISWLVHRGPIPARLRVLHRCDNPPCVNPAHLFLGTQQDNISDMVAKRRHRSSKPGERNGRARLTTERVNAIRAAHAAGRLQIHLAAEYGVGVSTINRVVRRLNWVAT
jgi:hypothetical protein